MESEYWLYLMRMRPPTPGAIPREGLVYANCDDIMVRNRHYWGTAVYNRQLTDEECEHYDMELKEEY